jgi:hypothetical protein
MAVRKLGGFPGFGIDYDKDKQPMFEALGIHPASAAALRSQAARALKVRQFQGSSSSRREAG